MRNSIYRITLDMHDVASQVQITAKQHDTARKLHITLSENGSPYTIEEGCRAVLSINRPGSTVINDDCEIKLNGSVIMYDFNSQTTEVLGINECEVKLYDPDGDIITSPRFTLLVDENVYNDGEDHGIDHRNILNRDKDDQHPIKAITGLEKELESKANAEKIYAEIALDRSRIDNIAALGQSSVIEVQKKYNTTGDTTSLTFSLDNDGKCVVIIYYYKSAPNTETYSSSVLVNSQSIFTKTLDGATGTYLEQVEFDGKAGDIVTITRDNVNVSINSVLYVTNKSTDTELADIRLGADGTIYPCAGDAVREQVSSLKGDLDEINSVVFESIVSANLLDNDNCLQDLIPKNWSGQDYNQSYASDGKWSVPAMPVTSGETYYVIATDGATKITPICIAYGTDGLFTKQLSNKGSDSDTTGHIIATFIIPDNIAWVRLYADEIVADENPFAVMNFKKKTEGVLYDFEVYGKITKLPKVATAKEVEEFKSTVDAEIKNRASEMDTCNLMIERGTFYSDFEQAGTARLEDAPYQYKRNGVISKKITMPTGDTTRSRVIYSVNGVQDNIVLFLYLSGSDYTLFNNEPVTIQIFVSKNSAYNNAYYMSFRTRLTVGWNAIKFNLDEMNVNGTPAEKSDMNCIEVNFIHSAESTKEVSFVLNGILVDSRMRPVIMVNHDGVYASDTEAGGKLELESQYNIPTTVFTNGMIDSDYKAACMDAVGTGMIEIGQYSCTDVDGIASGLGLSDARTALSDETTVDALTQYKLLKGTHDIVRDQLQGGDVIAYAGNQGYLTGMTMRTLRKLGIKIGRCTGNKYIGYFSKNEFAVGSVGLYTSVGTDTIKGYIDSAIEHGAAISLFTHTVTDTGEQYGCTKEQYAEIMSYIANLRNEGKCDLMTFRQFVDACY